jgi:hypothetical protein
VGYKVEDGNAGEEVCYWKDMTFFPHLLNLLTKSRIVAHVGLLPVDRTTSCRKVLARHLHSMVYRLSVMQRSLENSRGSFPAREEHPISGILFEKSPRAA